MISTQRGLGTPYDGHTLLSQLEQCFVSRDYRGHIKNEGRLDRCYQKGVVSDAMNVIIVSSGHNLRKILNKLRIFWLKMIINLMGYFIKPECLASLKLGGLPINMVLFRLDYIILGEYS